MVNDLTTAQKLQKDFSAGLVVFLVAIPLCLGIANASGAPLLSGLIAGVVGGLIIGALSGSHTSVSGPAAGLTTVVMAQIAALGSFEAFLLAVVLAGGMQVLLGVFKSGFIASFIPSSVIKGLLAAIGIILILKQIPHLLGHDPDPFGEMSFIQPDKQTTFSEITQSMQHPHWGAIVVGIFSLALLIFWDKTALKKLPIPSSLVVVVLGIGATWLSYRIGGRWAITPDHLVQVPRVEHWTKLGDLLVFPNWSGIGNALVWKSAVTIAIIASLETLLNVEAADNMDQQKRTTPANRELLAQGVGNMVSGAVGGLPMTSVVVRSSVNIVSGAQTKAAAIIHGGLLLISIISIPWLLNLIPFASLAALLLLTGYKMASPKVFKEVWSQGKAQFIPFLVTVLVIVVTDLLIGIAIGLAFAILFVLYSNFRRPLSRVVENHLSGDVLRIQLANQVSFLNRAALARTLDEVPQGGHVLIDATETDYIDPDILAMIREYQQVTSVAHDVSVSVVGFKDEYEIEDQIQYLDYTSRELQSGLTPELVLRYLREGNERFLTGRRLARNLKRQVDVTATGQHPMAVIVSCIDSRSPAELLFDLGLGDVFSVRIAGNVTKDKVLASVEYACQVAGAKLVLVLGHTACGAVNAAVDLFGSEQSPADATGCQHLGSLMDYIQVSVDPAALAEAKAAGPTAKAAFADLVAKRNVVRTVEVIREQSTGLAALETQGVIQIVGGMYDLRSGQVEFFRAVGGTAEPLIIPLKPFKEGQLA